MGTAGRSAPLRRTGSLLGLLGLELASVLALHWLGRFPGLRIRWDEPVPWLLSSPVQEVLGAVVRTVALVMAYWLLASTLLYLLASLTRLPSAVRAVSWATIPLVRRVADHAVAVTLATSMVGGSTLGVAGPALAADSRGGLGPPANKPAAAAQATGSTAPQDPPPTSAGKPAYVPDPADQPPDSVREEPPPPPAAEPEPNRSPSPAYVPAPADQAPRLATPDPAASQTTEAPTTETPTTETPTTEAPTTEAPTTEAPTTEAPTTEAPTTSAPPTTAVPTTEAAPPAAAAPAPANQGSAAATTSTSGLRTPAYTFPPATTPTKPPGGGATNDPGSGEPKGGGDTRKDEDYQVARGDNLWMIARDHLARARSGGSGEPTNREVADYWARVVEANRDGLRSGDPDLIYPGEEITLPPVD